jgi:hypothetical protein
MKSYNHVAIIITAILQVAVGMFMMSPVLFLPLWANAFGLVLDSIQPGIQDIVLGLATALAYNYLFVWLLIRQKAETLNESIKLTLLLWLGVIVVADLSHLLFAKIGIAGILINVVVRLVNGLIAGVILIKWRSKETN